MRRVILQEFVTLDGLAAGPNGGTEFVPASTKGDRSIGEEQTRLMDSLDTILLGRVTYEMFSRYWPDVADPEEKPVADKINAIPKIVFSRTLDRAPWGKWKEARVVRGSPAGEVAKLRQQSGKDMIVWGSLSLAQLLMREGLVDEYRMMICPVALGEGRSLFSDSIDAGAMRLVGVKVFDRGVALLKYHAADGRPATAGAREVGAQARR
jgi:dihydrofolate reductase